MIQLKRNLLSTTVLPAVVAAGAVLAVGFTVVPCGRGSGNRIYSSAAENPEAVPAPAAMRGMNAGCCAAACDACNPCEACCAACNPCAADCGASLQEAVSGMNAGCCAASCNPCAAACSPCNPCAAECNPCNPCATGCNPCAAGCGAYLGEAASGMNAGCCAADCNPCAAACSPCNPCAAACNPCNPCAACNPCNPCAASCGACGASLDEDRANEPATAVLNGIRPGGRDARPLDTVSTGAPAPHAMS